MATSVEELLAGKIAEDEAMHVWAQILLSPGFRAKGKEMDPDAEASIEKRAELSLKHLYSACFAQAAAPRCALWLARGA